MWLHVVYVLSGFLFIAESEGFVRLVKSNRPGVLCYTNETRKAVALVTNLGVRHDDSTPKTGTVEYHPIISDQKYIGVPCHLPGGCGKWRKLHLLQNETSLTTSRVLPPVTDRRWNNFFEYVTKGDHRFVTPFQLIRNKSGVFHLSVLALQNVNVIFSQDSYTSGFMAVLGGFVNRTGSRYTTTSKSQLWFCKDLKYDPIYGNKNGTLASKTHSGILMEDGGSWKTFSFEYKVSPQSIELHVNYSGERILSFNSSDPRYFQNSVWQVGFRSLLTPAFFRLHQYDVLRPINEQGQLDATFEVPSLNHRICFDVTYFYDSQSTKAPMLVSVLNSSRYVVFNSSLERKNGYYWQTERVQTEALPRGSYIVSIQLPHEFVYLGDIATCVNGTELVISEGNRFRALGVDKCEVLNLKHPDGDPYDDGSLLLSLLDVPPLGLTDYESDWLCKNLSGCSGVEYCAGFNCYCMPGFKRDKDQARNKCFTRCDNGFYGYKCSKRRGHCAPGYNIHNGDCTKGCQNKFRPPACREGRLVITKPPDVFVLGSRSALVNVTGSMKDLMLKSEALYKFADNFKGGEIQFINQSEWTTFHNFNTSQDTWTAMLEDIAPNTTHRVRIAAVEADNWRFHDPKSYSQFKTPCAPIDAQNTQVSGDREMGIQICRFTDDVCAWQKLSLQCDANFTSEWGRTWRALPCQLEVLNKDGSVAVLDFDQGNVPCLGHQVDTVPYEENPVIFVSLIVVVTFAPFISFAVALTICWAINYQKRDKIGYRKIS